MYRVHDLWPNQTCPHIKESKGITLIHSLSFIMMDEDINMFLNMDLSNILCSEEFKREIKSLIRRYLMRGDNYITTKAKGLIMQQMS